ncbi:hypothetical protein ACTID9_21450 [Brevibacillus fluminis]|uniref:hypothetical protein n=1 Tax=Brevibacillus fluminis TaxID=511487 RepID=UPI003F89B072
MDAILTKSFSNATPFPPTVTPIWTELSSIDWRFPKWMDRNGVVFGNTGNTIVKSLDHWTTWTNVATIPNGYGEPRMVLVGESGRIVVGTDAGHVFVSDEAQTSFGSAPVFTFESGYTDEKHGHCVYQNVILLCAYGIKNAANPPREVYMSRDYGATFVKIFDYPPDEMSVPGNFHIHDVEYDPYANRIWLAVGDTPNNQVFYSDDLGGTWTKVFSSYVGSKFTQIIAYPHGVVFGSDQQADGLVYWKRPKGFLQAPVLESDIVRDFLLFNDKNLFVHYATRRWVVRDKDYQMALVPWIRDNNDPAARPRLLASVDGLQWFEIYRHDSNQLGFYNIIGPHPEDPDRKILGIFGRNGTSYVFKASLPVFA